MSQFKIKSTQDKGQQKSIASEQTRLSINPSCIDQFQNKDDLPELQTYHWSLQFDDQYLSDCSINYIKQKLELYLTLLKYVHDLLKSIEINLPHMLSKIGLNVINSENQNQKQQNVEKKTSNNISNRSQLRNIILQDLFEMDFVKLKKIKLLLLKNSKKLIRVIQKMFLGHETWVENFLQKVELNVISNQKITKQSQDKKHSPANFIIINLENYENFLHSMKKYIFQKCKFTSLYNFLKDTVYKWICNQSTQIQKRQLNLLLEQVSEDYNVLNQQINDSDTKNQISRYDSNLIIKSSKQFKLQVQHEARIRASSSIFSKIANLQPDCIQKICCIDFVYDFTLIESNLYKTHPSLDSIIIIDYQAKVNPEKPKEIKFKINQTQIKQAFSALLNNNGGFILVGFKKCQQFYLPHTPIKHLQRQIIDIKSELKIYIENAIKIKNNKNQSPYKNFELDFIPIFKRRRLLDQDKLSKAHIKQGDFIWRITVFPDYQNGLALYPVNSMFFDFDRNRETFFRIHDSIEKKDIIYKKLKDKLSIYGNINLISKYNQSSLINHQEKCTKVQDGLYDRNINYTILYQNDAELSMEQKKKNQKYPQSLNQKSMENRTAQDQSLYCDPSKQQFKYINLIVLQSKQIKTNFQNYLRQRKINFLIQKTESSNLKKLSKQTYIIYHHRKFDQINSYLNEFKKKYNVKKNIILISAQKSVYIDQILNFQKLQQIQKFWIKEKLNWKQLTFVEDLKEKKSYIKGETKMSGIFLYFILSQLNYKAKIKNVPLNLHQYLISIDDVMNDKRIQEEKKGKKQPNNGKSKKKTEKKEVNNQDNESQIQKKNNKSTNQSANQIQSVLDNYWMMIDHAYFQCKDHFRNTYDDFYKHYKDQGYALEGFWNWLKEDQRLWNCFYYYRINELNPFKPLNYKPFTIFQNPNCQFDQEKKQSSHLGWRPEQ